MIGPIYSFAFIILHSTMAGDARNQGINSHDIDLDFLVLISCQVLGLKHNTCPLTPTWIYLLIVCYALKIYKEPNKKKMKIYNLGVWVTAAVVIHFSDRGQFRFDKVSVG